MSIKSKEKRKRKKETKHRSLENSRDIIAGHVTGVGLNSLHTELLKTLMFIFSLGGYDSK